MNAINTFHKVHNCTADAGASSILFKWFSNEIPFQINAADANNTTHSIASYPPSRRRRLFRTLLLHSVAFSSMHTFQELFNQITKLFITTREIISTSSFSLLLFYIIKIVENKLSSLAMPDIFSFFNQQLARLIFGSSRDFPFSMCILRHFEHGNFQIRLFLIRTYFRQKSSKYQYSGRRLIDVRHAGVCLLKII